MWHHFHARSQSHFPKIWKVWKLEGQKPTHVHVLPWQENIQAPCLRNQSWVQKQGPFGGVWTPSFLDLDLNVTRLVGKWNIKDDEKF